MYVVYSQLRATPTCNTNVLETIGPSFAAYTLGYSSSFLAYGTLEIPGPGCTESVIAGGFHTIDFSSLYYNPIVPTTSSKPGCPPWVNPRVSMATGLQDVDPSWGSCQPFFAGAYDPPSVLKKQSRLAPPLVAGAGPVTDAGPVATVIPAQAHAAPTPAADPGNNGPPPNPPSGNSRNPGPVNSPNPPQPAPAPADPGNAPANLPAASPFNPQNNPQNAPANAPPADPVSPPANPPAAPKADPINAPANAAAQSNPNPQNAPPNPAAAPPADPAIAPANNPVAAPPANPQNNPGYPAAAPPADPKTNTGTHHGAPVAGPASAPGNQPATPANPAQPPVAPNATPGNGGNTSPNKPAQPQANPNNPVEAGAAAAEGGGNSAPSDPTQLKIIPNNPPAKAGDPAPKGPTQLQATPINPPPQAPAQPQNNLNILAASGGNATPSDPNQLHNLPNNPMSQGSQATVQGSVVSVSSSNLVVGGSTYALPVPTAATPLEVPATIAIDGVAVQQLSKGGVVVAGQTLTPGTLTTISGNVVSVGSGNIVLGGTTYSLPNVAGSAPLQTPAPLMIGGNTMQQTSNGGLIIGGQTLTPGAHTTISGSSISVGASAVVVDGTTQTFLSGYTTTAGAVPSNEIVLTQSAIVTEGGKLVTYSGPAVSGFMEGKSELVVGTHTLQLVPSMTASASEKAALGGLILSALESNGSFGAASSSLGYTPIGNAGVGSLPTVNSTPAAEAGSRSLSGCWLFVRVFVAVAYIACLGIITH